MPLSGEQRHVTLPPAPESARQARRFVADVLTAVGADEFVDTATLLTSELVTNGIVHAHTELRLLVEATRAWVRVEVVDGNPMLPTRRGYDEQAQTGRGLEMVELLAADFGMQPLVDDGKRVWFRLGGAPGIIGGHPDGADPRGETVVVHLLHLPVTLYSAWQEHADAILREAMLVALNDNGGDLPEEFALASQALSALAAGTQDVFSPQLDTGAHLDVEVRLPRETVPNFPVLRDMLRRCSEMSTAGQLLVPPSLPEIQAVRRWVCDEVGRQTQDLSPRPWTDIVVEDVPVDPMSADAIDVVRASALPQIAADRWNRIIAVSESAARLLGWEPHELESRRLVTIIPPRLRDAHVAAFTRQMLGGPSRIIGTPTEVPALHRDGTELAVTMLLERQADSRGRALFVATLSPR
ncbi:MAG: PAS domain S-box protein [Actinomycetes bacterium]